MSVCLRARHLQLRLKNCITLQKMCKSIFYLTVSIFKESIAEEMTVGSTHSRTTDACQDSVAWRSKVNVYGPEGGQARAAGPLPWV